MPPEAGTHSLIPTPVSGVDVRRLPITPMEAFVLSRVDGKANDAEIALATGVPSTDVVNILSKLAGLGAVQYGTEQPSSPAASPAAASRAPTNHPSTGPRPSGPSSVPHPGAVQISYDASELDEPADLDPERRHRILETFHRLGALNHYELLGVPRDADKKAIKRAYFDVVGVFHPDKYFGKTLGSYKPKLERIFQRVTEAHDTLTRAASRTEYDSYLASQEATRAFDEPAPASVAEIQREIEREARQSEPATDASSTSRRPSAPSGPTAISSTPPPWSENPRPAMSADDRKRALARKLRASLPPGGPRASMPDMPAAGTPNAKEAAAESLRRRYEARLARALDERVHRYVKQAEEAVAAGNLIAATNALRIAVSLAPNDVPLADELARIERQAAATLADQYLEQARYDERHGRLAEAAHTYEKVIRGRPNAYVYERAAYCHLESGGDLKKASELAKKAVDLAPNESAYRITLARIFAKAGMEASAASELERARTLAPGDDTVKDWLKRLKRGEI